ncbi:MAG: hypothetical protein L0H84_00240 [Pseudonocardia sp.]|nr:hypothetical protein [Pseudonocardia sp.]
MTAATPESADEVGEPGGPATPCLVSDPWGGRIVTLLFVASVVLFVLAVAAIG